MPVRRLLLASLVAVAALVVLPWALPGKAGAATKLGKVSPPFPLLAPSGNFVQLQTATIPYTVPPPGGVITGWSHMGSAEDGSAGSGRLQLWRRVGTTTDFFLVRRSDLESFTAGIVNSFATRLPVSGGDRLGLRSENAASRYGGVSGDNVLELAGGDPAPGETRGAVPGPPESATLVNVAAVLEADADGDGFGDETQDQCPTNATTQGPCPPVPAPQPTPQPTSTCKGEPATIVGTGGVDKLSGTPSADVIAALGGNDKASGLAGNDLICGGAGKDNVKGGSGKDTLLGQKGKDTLKGGSGKDTLLGQKGKDTLKGGGGKDTCTGGKGNDTASACEIEKSI